MGDYIDRDAVFHAYEKEQGRSGPWDFKTLINSVPAADVAPVVHGRWNEYKRAHYFKCSQCKETVPYKKAALISGKRCYNYCPNCGAKMDKEE